MFSAIQFAKKLGTKQDAEAPIMELSQHKDVSVLKRYACLGLLSAGAGLAVALSTSAFADGKRHFDTRDSIEMSYFGTLSSSSAPLDIDDDGIVSPDGLWVVKVTHRGVLPEGVTEGTLWLFDAQAMRLSISHPRAKVPIPVPIAKMSAAANGIDFIADRGNTIYQVKWGNDSRTLSFLGRDHRENRRLFQVDLQTRKVSAFTPVTQDVVNYATTGKGFVYLAAADRQEEQEWWSTGSGIPDMESGTGSSLINLLYPHFLGDACCSPTEFQMWRVLDGRATPLIDGQTGRPATVVSKYGAEVMSLSPDERSLVTIGYDDARQGDDDAPLRYRLADMSNGTSEALVDPPVVPSNSGFGGRYRAVWSSDAREIAISLVSEPGTTAGAAGKSTACTVAIVGVTTKQMECVMPPRDRTRGVLYSMYWNSSGTQLRVRYRQWGNALYEDEVLERKDGRWTAGAKQLPPQGVPLQLTIREGLNEPPVLLATDTQTGKSRVVFDPNPQLANFDLGFVSVYEWKDPHGRTVQGGLAKPPGYVPGRRYPLVIQTHGFDSHKFFRVGYGETANAGRALAGRGMMVLQVAEPYEPYIGSWQAAMENGTNVYLAAIEKLSAEGLIDPKKVGVTGYSATGLLVSNAITRAPDRFAAAALSNTDNGSLTDYYTYIDYLGPEYAKYTADIFAGARPYGEGLQKWIERAPEFSTDKITAPVLLSPASPHNLITLWSLYAELRDQNKPVELQYIRSGQHNLAKPLQRFAQQEMLVDWFDFWLNSHEDAAPAKAAQYVRWRKLREMRAGLDKRTAK
jgi:dienelactone hydrolase